MFDGLGPIRRFANQKHILLIGDERRDSFAYQSVVVDRENANYGRTRARLRTAAHRTLSSFAITRICDAVRICRKQLRQEHSTQFPSPLRVRSSLPPSRQISWHARASPAAPSVRHALRDCPPQDQPPPLRLDLPNETRNHV